MVTWIENEIEENDKYWLRIYSNVEVECVILSRRTLNE